MAVFSGTVSLGYPIWTAPLGTFPAEIPCRAMDNGIQFAEQSRNRDSVTFRKMRCDLICEAHEINHRLTKPNPSMEFGGSENAPGECFPDKRAGREDEPHNRSRNVKRYHYDSHDQLRSHLGDL